MDLCALSVCSFSFPPLTRKELAIQAHHRKYSIEEEIDEFMAIESMLMIRIIRFKISLLHFHLKDEYSSILVFAPLFWHYKSTK